MAKAVKKTSALIPPSGAKKVLELPEEIKLIKRKIHYYDMFFEFESTWIPQNNTDTFIGFFSEIAKLATTKDSLRYQTISNGEIFVHDVIFKGGEKIIIGKLLFVKMDVLSQLIDKATDSIMDISVLETQGVVETTHFIIDYSRAQKKIALEYNHAGAKANDFLTYCQAIGLNKGILTAAELKPIARDELKTFKDRISSCSVLDFRVHRNNISEIEKVDRGFFSTLTAVKKQYQPEYIEIRMKFKYKKLKQPQKVQSNISTVVNAFVKDKANLELFESFKVHALDRNNDLKMKTFDLLVDKIQSEISVQRKPKHKVLISAEVFEKMQDEMRAINL